MTADAPELSETYDILQLLENAMGDCDIAEELLDRFHSRLATGRQSLERCVQEGDRQGAANIAHSLKGEAGILAASQVHHVAEKLELALQTPQESSVLLLVNELRDAADRCLNVYPEARQAIRETSSSEG